jgi:hypothetical protein
LIFLFSIAQRKEQDFVMTISLIEDVNDFATNTEHIAILKLSSGEVQKPKWKELSYLFWDHPREDDESLKDIFEFASYSFNEDCFVFTMNWASAQGGLVAVWNCTLEKWVCAESNDYGYLTILLKEYNMLVSFCDVANYVTSSYYALNLFPFKIESDDIYGCKEILFKEEINWKQGEFDPDKKSISNHAVVNDYVGQLGLFFSLESSILFIRAQDQFAQISMKELQSQIKKEESCESL